MFNSAGNIMRWIIVAALVFVSACDTVEPETPSQILSAESQVEYLWVIEKPESDSPYTKRWVTQSRYTEDAIREFIGSRERIIGYVIEK